MNKKALGTARLADQVRDKRTLDNDRITKNGLFLKLGAQRGIISKLPAGTGQNEAKGLKQLETEALEQKLYINYNWQRCFDDG